MNHSKNISKIILLSLTILSTTGSYSFTNLPGVYTSSNNILTQIDIPTQDTSQIESFNFLADGSIWEYGVNGGLDTMITHSITVSKDGWVLYHSDGFTTYYHQTRGKFEAFHSDMKPVDFHFPLLAGKDTKDVIVKGYSYITVPAGKFYCVEIITKGPHQWIAKNFGVIKYTNLDNRTYSLLRLVIPTSK